MITDQKQANAPFSWKGGMLADEMGLGKTLTIIALIASDRNTGVQTDYTAASTHVESIDATLIVVPPNVLSEWESQVERHTVPGEITWFKHHGKSRFDLRVAADGPNIVFTTYQTIETEWRKLRLKGHSIFSFEWRRVVLDEAHIIRNHTSATAKAIAALRATYRWTISGTPIQNSLNDLMGLLKFLRFHPYDELKKFDDDFVEPLRNGNMEETVQRLRKLLSCIMIRRLKKTTIALPQKRDKIVRIAFSSEERAYYDKIERPAVTMLDGAAESPYAMK
ncbi:MAG: hypothetical protein M1822_003926 [Bathelium mastoideum]|nr:MAG: hypothetical protein M1822_003926 [Bathelium mastoideum]